MSIYTDDVSELKRTLMGTFRGELPVLRVKARMSQENVAEKIRVSRQTYSVIETGKQEMSWTIFMALIALFQNDAQTKHMVNSIEGINEGMIKIMGR